MALGNSADEIFAPFLKPEVNIIVFTVDTTFPSTLTSLRKNS